MSYFIFNPERKVDVFMFTDHQGDDAQQITGISYAKTKHLSSQVMAMTFESDIKRTIRDANLPEIDFKVSIKHHKPVPCYVVTIENVVEPLVLRFADQDTEDLICEDSSLGRVQLTDLALYIRDKIMQILWKYNADLISLKGIYGHTHFIFQVEFSNALIERQARSFDCGLKKSLGYSKTSPAYAS